MGKVKEFFVVGSDDHTNENPKISGTDLRHVSLVVSTKDQWMVADDELSANGHRRMAEMVKAYIDWKVCEMGDTPSVGDLDHLYPIPALPRVSLLPHITHLLLPYIPGLAVSR